MINHRRTAVSFGLLLLPAIVATHALAESKNPADYPLRLHIFGRSQTTFYSHRSLDDAKGDGRANLFENGMPRGVDFSYECSDKLRSSIGYETYPARWKKQDRELTVLMPVFGKTDTYWTCNLKTGLKNSAYVMHNGSISEEPGADFKAWMIKHDYDPEHGKDNPVRTEAAAGAAAPSPAVATPAAPPQ